MTFEQRIKETQKASDSFHWPKMTIENLISAVFSVDTQEEASTFYEGYLVWLLKQADVSDIEHTRSVAKANIGWCFGEGMSQEKRELWRSVGASHPVFGSMQTDPSPKEALDAGRRAART
jgi:hypothetical protein